MSAGATVRSVYNASYAADTRHPIRVQEETLTASIGGTANAAPAGTANNPISAVVSRNRRQRGLIPRTVTLEAPDNGPPSGYLPGGITRIPALTEAFWNAATTGADCDYLGVTFVVVSRSPEIAQ